MMTDIVRSNPDVLMTMKLRNAEQVVQELVKGCGTRILEQLVPSIMDSSHNVQLIQVVARHLPKETALVRTLGRTLATCNEDAWSVFTTSDLAYLVELLNKLDLFKVMAEQNPELLMDEYNPVFRSLASESYWEARIEHYLGHGDFSQAWQQACHALRGFRLPGAEPSPVDMMHSLPEERDCINPVSTATFSKLVRRIFEPMAARNLVRKEITEELCRLTEGECEVIRYQGERRDQVLRKPPKPSLQWVERAGLKYAARLTTEDPVRVNHHIYLPEAIMVFRIAAHCAKKKREDARAKWLELCKRFSVDPATLEPKLTDDGI